jgi:hypothetical protein
MNIEQVLAMQPGPDLDRLVHERIFAKVGKRKPWSTTNAALEIITAIPVCAGPRLATDPDFKADRPYWGASFEHRSGEEETSTYLTTTRIFCATLPLALCKAGLMVAIQRHAQEAAEQ